MNKIYRFLPPFIVVLFGTALLLPLILSGHWFDSHDAVRYMLVSAEFNESIANGQFYPRWQANMYGGFGYPSFTFYQPAFFYLAYLFSLIIKNPLYVMYACLLSLFISGGLGVYCVGKTLSNRIVGVFAAAMFLLTPYLYCNLYVRGDLSEMMAMLVVPWPIYLLLKIQNKARQKVQSKSTWLYLILSCVLVVCICAHPATTIIFMPVFCLLCFAVCFWEDKLHFRLLFKLVASVALAVVLSSAYWFVLLQMKKYVQFGVLTEDHYNVAHNGVYIRQLFSLFWGFGHTKPGLADGMSFQLGAIHFTLATIGCFFARKKPFMLVVFGLYLLLIVMMLQPVVPLWSHIHMLGLIQFPWRILSVIAVMQIIPVCGFFYFVKDKKKRYVISALCVLVALTVFIHRAQFKYMVDEVNAVELVNDYKTLRIFKFTALNAINEFLPIDVNFEKIRSGRNGNTMIIQHPPEKLVEQSGSSPFHILYTFSSKQPTHLIINQFYFPGWKVILNGEVVSDTALKKNLVPDGRMHVVAGAGLNQTIEAYYDGPPHSKLRNVIVCVLALLLIVFLFIV